MPEPKPPKGAEPIRPAKAAAPEPIRPAAPKPAVAEPVKPAAKAAAAQAAPVSAAGDDNLLAGLCYIPILFIGLIVPLYVLLTEKKQNKFLAFHAWQSLLLLVVLIVVFSAVGAVVTVISFIPYVNFILVPLSCVFPVLGFALLLGWLYLAYMAYQGQKLMLPVLGEFADKQAVK